MRLYERRATRFGRSLLISDNLDLIYNSFCGAAAQRVPWPPHS